MPSDFEMKIKLRSIYYTLTVSVVYSDGESGTVTTPILAYADRQAVNRTKTKIGNMSEKGNFVGATSVEYSLKTPRGNSIPLTFFTPDQFFKNL